MKPIIFSTDMVQAILDGRKSMTRRVVKPPFPAQSEVDDFGMCEDEYGKLFAYFVTAASYPDEYRVYPRYQPGDILWVRETWFYEMHMHDLTAGEPDLPGGRYSHRYVYRASSPDYPVDVGVGACGWCPSIHMPREAARIFLRVTDVRVERLQEIPYNDCVAEGMWNYGTDVDTLAAYQELWQRVNAKSGYGWETNPWVFVVTFERCEKPEGSA